MSFAGEWCCFLWLSGVLMSGGCVFELTLSHGFVQLRKDTNLILSSFIYL